MHVHSNLLLPPSPPPSHHLGEEHKTLACSTTPATTTTRLKMNEPRINLMTMLHYTRTVPNTAAVLFAVTLNLVCKIYTFICYSTFSHSSHHLSSHFSSLVPLFFPLPRELDSFMSMISPWRKITWEI